MSVVAWLVARSRRAWITAVAGALIVGALFVALPKAAVEGAPEGGLPETAESARVSAILEEFPSADVTAGLLVWWRAEGLTDADRQAVTERASALAEESITPEAVRPQFSDDGEAALVAVPLDGAEAEDDVTASADRLRAIAADDLPAGLQSALTGPVGFQADVTGAFAGADLRLLLVTVAVVALLLIITYRSPLLWIVPLLVVGAADGLARFVVAAIAEATGLPVDASIAGILSVLVFGAGTNYALLLVARYREELRHRADRFEAMAVAVRSAGPAILASAGTVALSLLMLLFAELAGNRALGIACAIGIVLAMSFALLLLPAVLVLCGRGLFWPFVPRAGDGEQRVGFWRRLGDAVSHRPALVSIASVAGLVVLALGLGGYSVGLSQTDQLLGDPESVQAQEVIDDSFSAGATGGTIVLARDASVGDAVAIAEDVPGVSSARPGESADGWTRVDVGLDAEPQSDEAFAAVSALRSAFAGQTGEVGESLVGGSDATELDIRDAAGRDLGLVAPLILGVVFAVLALLLRSLVAPVLLLLTVVATFLASLGVSTWLFQNVFGFAALDTGVTLFAFLFLVALGVDYNIFLTTRAREERAREGTRRGMVVALATTGAVITSAGVLLAAVFAVLGVLPVVALAQIGLIVCIGVLLDTLVVRTLLVPALVMLVGDAFWWPSGFRSPHSHAATRASSGRAASVSG
ncbi:MMPL family transporter [Herbiconiux sp. L3-i23]|uniref:MMPL family transporter n=1 Tax=Herbiconiux sp. L3-i23 TaxID=2905871 RepID=UPI002061472E|nr:MMPL family transporter [Herbiconiux sp. L3-i23]BDI22652.1 membrane protein [Herbiconiux sp. L3-i23]